MKKQYIIVFCMFLYVFIGNASFVDLRDCRPQFARHRKKQFCYISFVKINGTKYLVKQKRYFDQFLNIVYDAFASYIAESLDSKIAHKVILIPVFYKFPGKKFNEWPATLHTIVPGVPVDKKRTLYRKIMIKQAVYGFNREMIYWMSLHKDLVTIIALDIFLCNHDRHRRNLFYNSKTDSFYAIDMDLLFEFKLARFACINFRRMSARDISTLKTKEIVALVQLRKLLERLVNDHDPERMIQVFNALVKESGLHECSFLNAKIVNAQVSAAQNMIRENYQDTKELIVVLGDIINRAQRKN